MVTAAYLNTRGRERHRDYQFVGPAPPMSWWREYADHTTFERPTVLVQSDGHGWQAYVSGIPSRRRDAVGTVIRYTVVATGESDAGASDGAESDGAGTNSLGTGDILALVATWLADQDLGRTAGRVSAVLDAAFPESDVERLITAEQLAVDRAGLDEPDDPEVARRLAGALHDLRLPLALDVPELAPDWLADLGGPPARAAFVQRVDALLGGQPGRALVLNLVGAAADLSGLLLDPRPLAVLAPDLPDPDTITVLDRSGREPAKKAEPSTRTSSPVSASQNGSQAAARNLRGCLRLVLVPIALVMALALALFGAIFYLR